MQESPPSLVLLLMLLFLILLEPREKLDRFVLKKSELDEEKEEGRESGGFVAEMGTRMDEIEMEETAIFVCVLETFF